MEVHSLLNKAQNKLFETSSIGIFLSFDQLIFTYWRINSLFNWTKIPYFYKWKNKWALLHKDANWNAKTEKVQLNNIPGHLSSDLYENQLAF